MFFFLRPTFKIDGFWVNHVPLPILFFFFPFASLSVDLWEDELEYDSFWED